MWYQCKNGELYNLDRFERVFQEGRHIKADSNLQSEAVECLVEGFFDADEAAAVLKSIALCLRDGVKLFNAAHWVQVYRNNIISEMERE